MESMCKMKWIWIFISMSKSIWNFGSQKLSDFMTHSYLRLGGLISDTLWFIFGIGTLNEIIASEIFIFRLGDLPWRQAAVIPHYHPHPRLGCVEPTKRQPGLGHKRLGTFNSLLFLQ